jgi:DNA-binding transcriptional regulator YdaS (Cro superfamily)
MEILREYIRKRGMTQKKFAEEILKVHPQWLNNLINGIISPSIGAAERIYKATNGEITIDQLRPDIARLLPPSTTDVLTESLSQVVAAARGDKK